MEWFFPGMWFWTSKWPKSRNGEPRSIRIEDEEHQSSRVFLFFWRVDFSIGVETLEHFELWNLWENQAFVSVTAAASYCFEVTISATGWGLAIANARIPVDFRANLVEKSFEMPWFPTLPVSILGSFRSTAHTTTEAVQWKYCMIHMIPLYSHYKNITISIVYCSIFPSLVEFHPNITDFSLFASALHSTPTCATINSWIIYIYVYIHTIPYHTIPYHTYHTITLHYITLHYITYIHTYICMCIHVCMYIHILVDGHPHQ